MAGKIFINYRRDDSIAVAGRLHDRLADTFGRDNLFMDVDNIPVGINFEDYLNNQVAQCDAMLSVIGPNWLNAKDEANQRRLDKPDDFVAIELSAALARNILVVPVLVDGTHMPKASELPASLKPLALRNAIQLRNTNFGIDAEQRITKMRDALALERPEHTEGLVLLSFITALIASFLFNVTAFLYALLFFFIYSGNNAGLLAAVVTAFPFFMVGLVTLQRDESVRMYGLVICVGGLLAVAAILASPQFFQIDVLTDPSIQGWIPILGLFFMIFAMNFGVDWKKIASIRFASNRAGKIMERWINSPWLAVLTFLGAVMSVLVTPQILYRLTDSLAAAFALVGVQLLVTGFCYVRYRKALAANPAQVPS